MTIEELKQALEAATPGPWEVDVSSDYGTAVCESGNSFIATWASSMRRRDYPHRANARLIVAAVNNLPALLRVAEAAGAYVQLNNQDAEIDEKGEAFYAISKAIEELNNDH